MTLLLVAANQTLEVEQLTDVDPSWKGIKIMTQLANIDLNLPIGSKVELQSEDPQIAGTYTVSCCLSPAAPRGWRLFLEPVSKATSGSANTDKVFLIQVSGVVGNNIRKSVVEYRVPFARLSETVKQITRMGGKIIQLTEIATYANKV
jgi:phycocyanin-associated rod protein